MSQYGVKALAAYTGLSPHTLRMWERRYGAVKPSRTASGRRSYSQDEAERLCLMAELTSRGHAISAIATLPLSELERRIADASRAVGHGRGEEAADGKKPPPVGTMFLKRMLKALEAFQLRELNGQLAAARANLGADDFVFSVVLPLLASIGSLIEAERLSVAHEHALSAVLKSQIYILLSDLGAGRSRAAATSARQASLAVATQEGDHHEFGILLATLLAEARGIRTHFFGCNMPANALASAANALDCGVLLIGRSIRQTVVDAGGRPVGQRAYLKELDGALAARTEIWIGGIVETDVLKARIRHKLVHVPTLEMLAQRLAALGQTR